MSAEGGAETTWLNKRERGTLVGIRVAFFMATLLGRTPMKPFVALLALYYGVFDRRASRASRDWLTRVHGRSPGFFDVYRHIRTFAQVTLDRVFLLRGKTHGFTFTRSGHEHLRRAHAAGNGAILLGAHLGSYEAMRAGGASDGVPINVLGYFENARMINALFERLDPATAARVIHLGDDAVGAMTRVKARLDDGEFVALLGDRVGLNDRVVPARFFGEEAPFAAGPFLLAAVLRRPVFLVFGIYREPNRYELHCEPFADRIELPRASREPALRALVQRYADRLESVAREAPDNWFNFFEFWSRR